MADIDIVPTKTLSPSEQAGEIEKEVRKVLDGESILKTKDVPGGFVPRLARAVKRCVQIAHRIAAENPPAMTNEEKELGATEEDANF